MSKTITEESTESRDLAEWPFRKLAEMLLVDLGPGGSGLAREIQSFLAQRTVEANEIAVARDSKEFERGFYAGRLAAQAFIADLLGDYVALKYRGVDMRKLDPKAVEADQETITALAKDFALTFELK